MIGINYLIIYGSSLIDIITDYKKKYDERLNEVLEELDSEIKEVEKSEDNITLKSDIEN